MEIEKDSVQGFWETASCGEDLYLQGLTKADYEFQARRRYELEPYIDNFAAFRSSSRKRVLEIGVGLGADHQRFAEEGAVLTGVDLTARAVVHTKRRLALFGLETRLSQADAENLPFSDGSFDIVYSWGVLHHSPDTVKAISEVHRVLTEGGTARVMIYYKWSLVGLMLWLRYGVGTLRPWISLSDIYSRYLESPGTKAYTVSEASRLFWAFRSVEIETVLTHGDLLASEAGQRHRGLILDLARRLWPRAILRRLFPRNGLFMLITAQK